MHTRLTLAALATLAASAAHAQRPNWPAVDSALGRKAAAQPGGVMRYGFPRSDLNVTVDGVRLMPAFALGGWLAFRDVGGGHAMAMGDLVLLESEVAPVMRALQAGGVQQTALHNHVLGESPHVMYMHVSALGEAVAIARTVRDALSHTATPAPAPPSATAPAIDIDTAGIARALGVAGKANGSVYQVSVPRRETIREHGHEVPPSMGVATAINFQPTGSGRAAITGDFVLRADEVNLVIRALHDGGVTVTALHSHMLGEEPRLLFMHFWANDDAAKLARTLRSALDHTAVKTASR